MSGVLVFVGDRLFLREDIDLACVFVCICVYLCVFVCIFLFNAMVLVFQQNVVL